MQSSKSGDEPYRHLLDIFVEDFITCLGSTDWPAAELLLRCIATWAIQQSLAEKASAPVKNMALDILGVMVAAISELRSNIRHMSRNLDEADSALGQKLARLSDEFLEGKIKEDDIISWHGPYRAAVEYLDERSNIDPHLETSSGYCMMRWSEQILTRSELLAGDEGRPHRRRGDSRAATVASRGRRRRRVPARNAERAEAEELAIRS